MGLRACCNCVPFGGRRKTPAIQDREDKRFESCPAFRLLPEGLLAQVQRSIPKFFFDAQELIVFRNPIGSAGRPGFDLTRVGGDCKIGDKGVFRFTGTMRNNAE